SLDSRRFLRLSDNGLSLHRFSEDLDRGDVHIAARSMSAARHQIGEANFVNLAQIRMFHPVADSDDSRHIELHPSHVGNRDVVLIEINGWTGRAVSYEPRAIGQFHHRPHLMKAGGSHRPANLREWRCEVNEVVAIAKRGCTG